METCNNTNNGKKTQNKNKKNWLSIVQCIRISVNEYVKLESLYCNFKPSMNKHLPFSQGLVNSVH